MFGFTWHAIFVLFAWQGTWCKTTIFRQDGATVPLASFIDIGPAKKQPGTWLEKKESPYEEQNDPGMDWPTLQSTVQPYNELAHSTINTMTQDKVTPPPCEEQGDPMTKSKNRLDLA